MSTVLLIRNKHEACKRIYLNSVAIMLITTAVGKVVMAIEGTALIDRESLIFVGLSIREVLLLTAMVETLIALFVLSGWKERRYSVMAVAWLGTVFLSYRFMLWASGYHGYCDCLGSLSQTLRLTAKQAHRFAFGILLYILVGSYGYLLWSFLCRGKSWTNNRVRRDNDLK